MFIKRLFPERWARILSWTTAAIAWGAVAAMSMARAESVAAPVADGSATTSTTATTQVTTTSTTVPTQPANGLVIIRYVPVPPPQAEVIVNTVTVQGKAPKSAGSPSVASSAPTVTSSGS